MCGIQATSEELAMPITIRTWNVQNFAGNDPLFADKLAFIVGTLQALNPDVIALQEILDPSALQSESPPAGRLRRYSGLGSSLLMVDDLTDEIRADRNQELGPNEPRVMNRQLTAV
jgi:hypothetical protein